jgi:hypothetical protein
VAWIVAVNVAAAAWFHWTWEVEKAGSTISCDPLAPQFSEHLLSSVLDRLKLPGYDDEVSGQLDWCSHDSNVAALPARQQVWVCCCFFSPPDIWERQLSRVRFHWKDGREKHGPTRLYLAGGHLYAEEHWRQGELHGSYRRWYPTGEKLLVGQYDHGQQHGQWTVWAKDGKQVADLHFDRGRSVGVWWLHFDPRPPLSNELFALADAVARKHPQATIDYRWEFAAGEVCRLTIDRRGDGNDRVIRRHYVQGERHGRQEHVDARGQIRFESHWQQGQPDGWWACYDEQGECVLNAEFQGSEESTTIVRVNGRDRSSWASKDQVDSELEEWEDIGRPGFISSFDYSLPLTFTGERIRWDQLLLMAASSGEPAPPVIRRQTLYESGLGGDVSLEWEGLGSSLLFAVFQMATDVDAKLRHNTYFLESKGLRLPPDQGAVVDAAIQQLEPGVRESATATFETAWDEDLLTTWQRLEVEFGRLGVKLQLREGTSLREYVDDKLRVYHAENSSLHQHLAVFLTVLDWQCTAEDNVLTVGPAIDNRLPH